MHAHSIICRVVKRLADDFIEAPICASERAPPRIAREIEPAPPLSWALTEVVLVPVVLVPAVLAVDEAHPLGFDRVDLFRGTILRDRGDQRWPITGFGGDNVKNGFDTTRTLAEHRTRVYRSTEIQRGT